MKWNPYFDWCSILISPKPIPPKQRKSGPKNKEFENIIAKIHNMDVDKKWYPQNQWPWKEKLFIMLAFSGPAGYLENCDVDNLSKAALDAYKGIVYEDDKQVYYLLAFKKTKPIDWISENTPVLTIGIKKVDEIFELNTVPNFFVTSDTDTITNVPEQIFFQVDGENFHYEFINGMTEEDFTSVKKEIMKKLKP